MHTVEDDAGDRFLVVATEGERVTVLDPATGERETRASERFHRVEDAPPLATAARALPDATALCESDLHGRLAALQAADLVATVDVDGRNGYRLTPRASEALDALGDQPNGPRPD